MQPNKYLGEKKQFMSLSLLMGYFISSIFIAVESEQSLTKISTGLWKLNFKVFSLIPEYGFTDPPIVSIIMSVQVLQYTHFWLGGHFSTTVKVLRPRVGKTWQVASCSECLTELIFIWVHNTFQESPITFDWREGTWEGFSKQRAFELKHER